MTCIVGVTDVHGNVYIGGDRASVSAYVLRQTDRPKIFKRGSYLIGYSGSYRMGQLLEHVIELPTPTPDEDITTFMVTTFISAVRKCFKDHGHLKIDNNRDEIGGVFMVGIRGVLFSVWSDLQMHQSSNGYESVGAGDEVALGSLCTSDEFTNDQEYRVRLALIAAAAHSTVVCSPFDIFKMDLSNCMTKCY